MQCRGTIHCLCATKVACDKQTQPCSAVVWSSVKRYGVRRCGAVIRLGRSGQYYAARCNAMGFVSNTQWWYYAAMLNAMGFVSNTQWWCAACNAMNSPVTRSGDMQQGCAVMKWWMQLDMQWWQAMMLCSDNWQWYDVVPGNHSVQHGCAILMQCSDEWHIQMNAMSWCCAVVKCSYSMQCVCDCRCLYYLCVYFVRECLRLCTCVCVSVMQLRIWFSVELWVCQIVCGVLCWIGRCNVYWFKLLYWIVAWTTQGVVDWVVNCIEMCDELCIALNIELCVVLCAECWIELICDSMMLCSDAMQWCNAVITQWWVSEYSVIQCNDVVNINEFQTCDAVMQWSNAVQCRYAVMRCMMQCSSAMQSCNAVVRCSEDAVMKCNNAVIIYNDEMHCSVQWSDELTMFGDANNWWYARCNDDVL